MVYDEYIVKEMLCIEAVNHLFISRKATHFSIGSYMSQNQWNETIELEKRYNQFLACIV